MFGGRIESGEIHFAGRGGCDCSYRCRQIRQAAVLSCEGFRERRVRGGADCLNMIVPYGDDAYYQARRTLAIPRPDSASANRVLPLDNFFGLNPDMRSLHELFTGGHLTAIHAFQEDLYEGLGLPSLYNLALGSVCKNHVYDRVKDRDKGVPTRAWD